MESRERYCFLTYTPEAANSIGAFAMQAANGLVMDLFDFPSGHAIRRLP